jgi:hypothetical protein
MLILSGRRTASRIDGFVSRRFARGREGSGQRRVDLRKVLLGVHARARAGGGATDFQGQTQP